MTRKSFYTLYEQGLTNKGYSCVQLHKKLAETGTDISERSLQRYRRKEMRPNAKNAKKILECLGIQISEEEVLKSLELAKEDKIRIDNSQYIERGFRIPIKELSDTDENVEDITRRLGQRILEIEGIENLNRYVTQLIKEDLNNHTL